MILPAPGGALGTRPKDKARLDRPTNRLDVKGNIIAAQQIQVGPTVYCKVNKSSSPRVSSSEPASRWPKWTT